MRPCESAASYGSFFDNRAECWDHRRMGEALRHPTLRPSGFGIKSRLECFTRIQLFIDRRRLVEALHRHRARQAG
jgi:hypothetical protein